MNVQHYVAVMMLISWLMLQMEELLADITDYSSRFNSCWDFQKKYEKTFGKMLASLE